ncbi:MAG: ThiF family adenylyltransferase, partial [Patescibacteria group bacterium]|nr:ThiF family adenylyltransferase [Patescibacteria group bacterium]
IVIEGTISVDGSDVPIQVVYPPAFPYLRPEVISRTSTLDRHQNPYSRNLCVIPNEQDSWNQQMTGAFMVEQAVALLEANRRGSADVAAREVDAPEPMSTWYPYNDGCSFIVLQQPPKTEPGQFGTFFAKQRTSSPYVQVALTGMRIAKVSGEWSLDNGYAALSYGQEIVGTWLRCSARPPFLGTPGSESNYDNFLQWAKSQDKNFSYRLAELRSKNNGTAAFGLVYMDEGPARGQYHENWLVGVESTSFRVLLRPMLWTPEDQMRRIPALQGLREKKVLLIGLGALGSPMATALARASVGHLGLVDFDFVDAGPLVRQDYDLRDLGLPKVAAAEWRVRHANPHISPTSAVSAA